MSTINSLASYKRHLHPLKADSILVEASVLSSPVWRLAKKTKQTLDEMFKLFIQML